MLPVLDAGLIATIFNNWYGLGTDQSEGVLASSWVKGLEAFLPLQAPLAAGVCLLGVSGGLTGIPGKPCLGIRSQLRKRNL